MARETATSTNRVAAIRTRVAQALWLVCLVFALFMALGALTYALDAKQGRTVAAAARFGESFA